jgi:hypothetical protein
MAPIIVDASDLAATEPRRLIGFRASSHSSSSIRRFRYRPSGRFIATLLTQVCLAFPVIHALGDGHEVYFVTDASGDTRIEAHEMGIARMIQAEPYP